MLYFYYCMVDGYYGVVFVDELFFCYIDVVIIGDFGLIIL